MKTASIHHPPPTKGACGGAQKAYLFKQLGGWRRRELIRLLPTNVTVSIRNTHRTVILLRQLDGEQRRAENTSRSSSGSSSIDFTSSRISCFGNSVIPCLQDQFIFWDILQQDGTTSAISVIQSIPLTVERASREEGDLRIHQRREVIRLNWPSCDELEGPPIWELAYDASLASRVLDPASPASRVFRQSRTLALVLMRKKGAAGNSSRQKHLWEGRRPCSLVWSGASSPTQQSSIATDPSSKESIHRLMWLVCRF